MRHVSTFFDIQLSNSRVQAKEKLKEYEAALRHNTNGHVA